MAGGSITDFSQAWRVGDDKGYSTLHRSQLAFHLKFMVNSNPKIKQESDSPQHCQCRTNPKCIRQCTQDWYNHRILPGSKTRNKNKTDPQQECQIDGCRQ
jgi:hypothetical protein